MSVIQSCLPRRRPRSTSFLRRNRAGSTGTPRSRSSPSPSNIGRWGRAQSSSSCRAVAARAAPWSPTSAAPWPRPARAPTSRSRATRSPIPGSPRRCVSASRGIKAKVTDQCGQWPNDLASGSSIEGWDNKPYWNLGCSTQSMIAAQTADPRDLVEPRGEEVSDTQMRARGIEAVRAGADPNTSWHVQNSNIATVGGGS